MARERIATVIIKDADKFTAAGRRRVVAWLHHCAEHLDRHAGELDGDYRSYYYAAEKGKNK